MKIELSLSENYVSHWGVNEALRELYQNAIDNEKGFESNYDANEATLEIVSKNIVLDKSTLLLGESTKRNDSSTIGQFGEGYKLAILVLVRNGIDVVIETKNELWTFSIEQSAKFNTRVLIVEITARSITIDHTVFMLLNLTNDMYTTYQENNLHIQTEYSYLDADTCQVLLDEPHVGRIFVGGLFICDYPGKTMHGFNFKPGVFPLGRDRKIISGFDANYQSSRALTKVCQYADVAETIVNNIDNESHKYIAGFVESSHILVEAAWRKFKEEYPDCIPAYYNTEELTKKYTGVKTVNVPENYYDLLIKSPAYKEAIEELELRPTPDTPSVTLSKFYSEWQHELSDNMKIAFGDLMLEAEEWRLND